MFLTPSTIYVRRHACIDCGASLRALLVIAISTFLSDRYCCSDYIQSIYVYTIVYMDMYYADTSHLMSFVCVSLMGAHVFVMCISVVVQPRTHNHKTRLFYYLLYVFGCRTANEPIIVIAYIYVR